jgi:hypothetical protein
MIARGGGGWDGGERGVWAHRRSPLGEDRRSLRTVLCVIPTGHEEIASANNN